MPWSVPIEPFSATRRPNSLKTITATRSASRDAARSSRNALSDAGELLQQRGVARELVAVGVVVALLEVVDARAQPGLDQPRRQLEPPGQLRLGIAVHGRRGPGDGLEAVRRRVGVQQAAAEELPQVVTGGRGADRPGLGFLVGQGIVVEPVESGADGSPAADGRRRRVGADQQRRRGAVAGRRAAVEAAADPAQAGVVELVEAGRLPDLHAAEVRAVRVGIADPRHDRQPARFQQLARVAPSPGAGRPRC